MQINGGRNNKFAAWADSGGLVMMYIPNNNPDHPLWALARDNVLADNFFHVGLRRLVPEPPVPHLLVRAGLSR